VTVIARVNHLRAAHQPVSVVSQCSLIAWLNGMASGDQRFSAPTYVKR